VGALETALREGHRGLPGGDSLARLLPRGVLRRGWHSQAKAAPLTCLFLLPTW
jgi:hypothetical protein